MDVSNTNRFVIISDSRGKTLERFLPLRMLQYIDIRHYNGLTLNLLNERLPKWSFLGEVNTVYFMVGINDFTLLDHETHSVRLVTPFTSGLIDKLKTELQNLVATMKGYFPKVSYIICPIYGLDINRYNKTAGRYRYQDSLDLAIVKVNVYIGKLNTKNNQLYPFLSNVFHRYRPKSGSYITLYDRLADGLHPGDAAQRKIANYLRRSILKSTGNEGK